MTTTRDKPKVATNTDTMMGFPAPEHLATPTDLEPSESRAITEAVNPPIADAPTLYLETKQQNSVS